MNLNQFPAAGQVGLYILFIALLALNGYALWHSARNNQRNWFIVLLVVHGTGILEIAYLFFFAKKKITFNQLKFWEK